ncbi:MAG TPA: sugar-binding domain-containing protein, partial [Terriglobales bacterium]|nr:sugar-binding domain-containing protein [Terriglobales bacterium]
VDSQLLQTLKQEGCVGEICGHAYNLQGEICSPELSDRALGIDLVGLRNKELSVALAGGLHKLDAIRGALQGHYVNVLITDEGTAAALLQQDEEPRKGG